jgi:hypothetical protein
MGEPRQLNIFKGRRQKGELPPGPSEFALGCALADTCRQWLHKDWKFFHVPNGERRDPVAAMRCKRQGVSPGVPDYIFVGPGGRIFFLELKRVGGRLSEAQLDWQQHLMRCGFPYLVTNNLADALGELYEQGIVRARVGA